MALRTLSLCSGAGAVDLGVSWAADIQTVCYVEREAFAAATLVARMADEALDRAPVWDDLVTFDGAAWRGAVDLIIGGFPCQPASTAGRRAGTSDDRWLWPDIVRIIRAVGPRLCFFENVPGLLSVNGGAAFHEVVESLSDLGYDAEWDCFSAAEIGAPHKRDRLFILAYHSGERGERWGLSARSADGNPESDAQRRCAAVADTRSPRFQWSAREGKPGQRGASVLPFGRDSEVGDAERRGLQAVGVGSLPPNTFPPGPADAAAWATVLAARPDLAPAIDGRLNPAFVEWLMGWPEGWSVADSDMPGRRLIGRGAVLNGEWAPHRNNLDGRDPSVGGSRADRLRLIGNGVVPQCAAVAFTALCERAGLT